LSTQRSGSRAQSLRILLERTTQIAFVLVLIAFAIGLLGERVWAFDLLSHFRVQYGYALLVCALLLSWLRVGRWAVPAWMSAAFVAWPVLLSHLPTKASAHGAAQSLPSFKVVTLNAWFRNENVERIARYLATSEADVIVIQEFDSRRMRELMALLPDYPHSALDAAQDRHGAAILSRWPIESSQPLSLSTGARHAQWARVRWHSTAVEVVGVHLPWPLGARVSAQRNQELYALAQWMRTRTGPLVVAGDFNLSPWSPHFVAALEQAQAQDAFASQRPLRTWPTRFAPLGIRIDHCWTSQDWHVAQAIRGPDVGSDHYPLLVELRPKKNG
jgi:endonuclease/exonuclease/phosphatase (EEP) superfamily protein YafD